MPTPLSSTMSQFPSVQTVTRPPGVYFTALESTCSTTSWSHFSSVSTRSSVSRSSRDTFPRMKRGAYRRTA